MQNNAPPPTIAPDSSESSATVTTPRTTMLDFEYRTLASQWSSINPKIQEALWSQDPLVPPIINSLYWIWNHTKTRDDQDPNRPYKPFPVREYLKALHRIWIREPFLFVEKSRTMMLSWWAAAETLHRGMTYQPSSTVYWAQDEDRAVALLGYAKTLYAQQDDDFKAIFPLTRPLEMQGYKSLELKDGAIFHALPGKDPDKIRSLHPSQLVMDEACFIENGGEAFDVGISSRVPRVLVISSAAPSWFRRLTKPAVPIALDPYL